MRRAAEILPVPYLIGEGAVVDHVAGPRAGYRERTFGICRESIFMPRYGSARRTAQVPPHRTVFSDLPSQQTSSTSSGSLPKLSSTPRRYNFSSPCLPGFSGSPLISGTPYPE